ncbi:hypothetical protein B0I35DRAFT_437710 [Stachybotrys elegans]|uniref:G domain-containing protein n=1 Tax=Stachybotrys elegans TaxID=80388 RepID=A0A8K0SLK1_9HYPO|nr:hypothetical protein B0I35DRAFT_437710 [Stachybotrys elegans]
MAHFKDQGLSRPRKNGTVEYVIGIMGRRQSGKSVFGDTYTGRFELRREQLVLQSEAKTVTSPSGDAIKLKFIEIPCLSSIPPPSCDQVKLIDEVLVDSYKQGQRFIGIVYLSDSRDVDDKGLRRDLEYVDAIIGSDCHRRTVLVWNKTTDAQSEAPDIELGQRIEIGQRIWNKRFNPPTMEPDRNPDAPINRTENPPRQGTPNRIVQRFLEGELDAVQVVLGLQRDRTGKEPLSWGETKVFKLWESHQGLRGKMRRIFKA